MSGVLARWNAFPMAEAVKEILPCCGSKAWAGGMAARRPFAGRHHSASSVRRNLE